MTHITLQIDLNEVQSIALSRNRMDKRLRLDVTENSYDARHFHFENSAYKVVIWGDPAQRGMDARILNDILYGIPRSYYGRAWLALDKLRGTASGSADMLGAFPLLIYRDSKTTIIANRRNAIVNALGYTPTINREAMIQLLADGQMLDNQSIFENTQHLSFGNRIYVDLTGKIEVSRNQPKPILGFQETRFEDALDAFAQAAKNIVRECPNPIVSLSGGLDSRLILAAILAAGGKPSGLCYGSQSSGDMKIARDIATTFNLPLFTSNGALKESPWQASKRIANAGCGEVPVHHAHALIDENLLAQTQGAFLVTGTGAETYRAFYYDRGMPGFSLLGWEELNSRLKPRAHRYIREEFGKLATPFILALPRYEQYLDSLLSEKIEQLDSDQITAASFLDNFYLQVRVPRMVMAGQQMLEDYYLRSHPFLDQNVVDQVGNLPSGYKLGSTFHRKAIARLNPKLAEIEWDKTSRPLSAGLPWRNRYPALAEKMGLMPQWGKSAEPIYHYREWLQHMNAGAVRVVSDYLGLSLAEAKCAIPALIESPYSTHLFGYSAVWAHLLANSAAAEAQRGMTA